MSRCPEKHDQKDATIRCKTCHGKGKTGWWGTECSECKGEGRVICPKCEVCPKCKGSGDGWLFSCGECSGTGRALFADQVTQQSQAPKAAPVPPTPQKSLTELGIEAYRAGNYSKAHDYFQRAANRGDAESEYFLGLLYSQGKGCEPNIYTAESWFKQAANRGHRDAQNRLSKIQQWKREQEWQWRAQQQAEMEEQRRREEARRIAINQMQDENRRRYGP